MKAPDLARPAHRSCRASFSVDRCTRLANLIGSSPQAFILGPTTLNLGHHDETWNVDVISSLSFSKS
jgi:hypothetical protein